MMASNCMDADGFKLQFEDNITVDEQKFYIKYFPRVDDIAKERIHCTTCNEHIGTAPIAEKIIRTHQVLHVTQCNKCYAFYNSGEFGKGEDGSEYYCRWCGQGGEVFCCSSCPFVFCNKCIKNNLTSSYVKDIEENDDWMCFVCDKSILKKLRAQHWALRNYMNKQLEKIQKIPVSSEDDLNNLLNEDTTTCCPKRKRKSIVKPVTAPLKRPSMNGVSPLSQPPAKRASLVPPSRPVMKLPPTPTTMMRPSPLKVPAKPAATTTKGNNEIVCTPDILGLFNENSEAAQPQFPHHLITPTLPQNPPPLVMRNETHARNKSPSTASPTATPPNPIYHTVNGYQIDLNHAARQEIFRLPNGKLIQVRKQSNTPVGQVSAPVIPNPRGIAMAMPRGTQFTIRPATGNMPTTTTTTTRMFRPQIPPQVRLRSGINSPQQRFTFTEGRVVPVPNVAPPAPAPAPAPQQQQQATSTVFTQQNGSISVARAQQPDTQLGKAKTEFEDKIISGMEICQHTINKMITLSNSTSFKTSRSFSDMRELYIHLQYLFTYTTGKFKTLQESLTTGMEGLAQYDPSLKEKNDDDELEIVEQKTDIIEVDSDDDDEEEVAVAPVESKEPAVVPVKKPLMKHIQYTSQGVPESVSNEVEKVQPPMTEIPIANGFAPKVNVVTDDKRLCARPVVKLEKLEDSKNVIIKQYMAILLEQRKEDEAASDMVLDEDIADVAVPLVDEPMPQEPEKQRAGPASSKIARPSPTEIVDIADSDEEGEAAQEPELDDALPVIASTSAITINSSEATISQASVVSILDNLHEDQEEENADKSALVIEPEVEDVEMESSVLKVADVPPEDLIETTTESRKLPTEPEEIVKNPEAPANVEAADEETPKEIEAEAVDNDIVVAVIEQKDSLDDHSEIKPLDNQVTEDPEKDPFASDASKESDDAASNANDDNESACAFLEIAATQSLPSFTSEDKEESKEDEVVMDTSEVPEAKKAAEDTQDDDVVMTESVDIEKDLLDNLLDSLNDEKPAIASTESEVTN